MRALRRSLHAVERQLHLRLAVDNQQSRPVSVATNITPRSGSQWRVPQVNQLSTGLMPLRHHVHQHHGQSGAPDAAHFCHTPVITRALPVHLLQHTAAPDASHLLTHTVNPRARFSCDVPLLS